MNALRVFLVALWVLLIIGALRSDPTERRYLALIAAALVCVVGLAASLMPGAAR